MVISRKFVMLYFSQQEHFVLLEKTDLLLNGTLYRGRLRGTVDIVSRSKSFQQEEG